MLWISLLVGIFLAIILSVWVIRIVSAKKQRQARRATGREEDQMEFHTAYNDGIDRLYHWEPFNEEYLRRLLCARTIYFSDPADFNDPWDCKPWFSTKLLEDPVERDLHIQWAVDISRQHNDTMSEEAVSRLEMQLRADPKLLAETVDEISLNMADANSGRYRVYCLGPDVGNLLMWSHYADKHKGICLEFSTRDEVMCCPLRVEYPQEFPVIRVYSNDLEDNLRPFLTKADVWKYEHEYRLIAQERGVATADETLITDNNLLRLPETALLSVIVGCQGDYGEVERLIAEVAPELPVKKAVRVPNRFELRIE